MEEALIENLVLGNDHKESMKKINENLVQYGLTPNQSKVYLYLTKTGEKTASAISKNLLTIIYNSTVMIAQIKE